MNETERRFWDKIDTSGKCWDWTSSLNNSGYGQFYFNGRPVLAHRFVYSLVYGNIPKGMCICHHCDNPRCIKPSHLFMGTLSDNQQDSIAKGRRGDVRGENSGRTRLCENDVHEIRRLYSLGGITQATLGKMWEITPRQISDIVRRVNWGHI